MTDEELIARLRSLGLNSFNIAADRVEALIGERDEALNQLDSAKYTVDVLKKRLTDRTTKLTKAVAALRFYADVSNYDEGIVGITHEAPMWSESDFTEFEWDNGEKARAVLAQIGETE